MATASPDIDLKAELAFHRAHGKMASVAAVRPAMRFGAMTLDGDRVSRFAEKPVAEAGWVSGSFFMLSPRVGELIKGDTTVWEAEPMGALAQMDELRAYVHDGFWHPMDTLRDKMFLDEQWISGQAKWKIW